MNIKNFFDIDDELLALDKQILKSLENRFLEIDDITEYNQLKVLKAFTFNGVSEATMAGSTGYGYDDRGREILERVMADCMGAEDAIMRHNFVSGTHTLTVALFGVLRPNDKVKITVKRGDQTKQFEAVLRNKAGKAELIASDYVDAAEALGGTFSEVNERTRKQLDIDGGIRVNSIEQGGVLAQARIRQGYIITHINEQEVRSVRDLDKIGEEIYSIEGVYPDGRRVTYSLVQPR